MICLKWKNRGSKFVKLGNDASEVIVNICILLFTVCLSVTVLSYGIVFVKMKMYKCKNIIITNELELLN